MTTRSATTQRTGRTALLTLLLASSLLLLPAPAQAERPWVDDARGHGARGLDITAARYDYSGPYVGTDVRMRRLGRAGTVRQGFGIEDAYVTLSFTRRRDGSEVRRATYSDRGTEARVRCPVTGRWDRTRDLVTMRVGFRCLRTNRYVRGYDLDPARIQVTSNRGTDYDVVPPRWVGRN